MISLITPEELQVKIAAAARAKRLALNLSQKSLSDKSGVSYGVIKKFESTGQISLGSLLALALVLEAMDDFNGLFAPRKPELVASLDALIEARTRKRGRK